MAEVSFYHRNRRRIFFVLRVLVSLGLIVFLVQKAGFGSILRTIGEADPRWLSAGFALGLVAAALQANQWRGLLGAMGLRRGYLSTLQIDTAARVFDAALPTSIGGDVARSTMVSRNRGDRLPSALSVVLRRIMQVPGLVVVILVGLGLSWSLPYVSRVRAPALACAIAGIGLMLVLVATTRVRAIRRVPLPTRVRNLSEEWSLAHKEAVSGGRPFLTAGLRGLLFWVVVVLSQACFMQAVGIQVPFGYAMVVVATVNAISMLPISLGGYGLREGVFSAFLTVSGQATTAQGAAVGACLSIQTLALGIIGGLVYLSMRRPDRSVQLRPRHSEPTDLADDAVVDLAASERATSGRKS